MAGQTGVLQLLEFGPAARVSQNISPIWHSQLHHAQLRIASSSIMDILLANCPASIPPKVALPFDGEEIDLRELIEEIVVTVPSPSEYPSRHRPFHGSLTFYTVQREHTAPVERSAQGDVIQDCREIFSTLILSPLEVPLDCDLLEDRISILTERIEMLNQDQLFRLTKGKTAFFKRLHNFAEGLQTILSSRTMLIEAYAKAETFLKQRERAVMERVSARMDPLDWPRYAGNVVPPPMGRRRQEIGDALKAKRPYASRKQFVPRGGVTILHNWVRDSNDFVHSLRLVSIYPLRARHVYRYLC